MLSHRCLNYFLTLGSTYALEVNEKNGLGILLQCLNLASQGYSTALQELAQVSARRRTLAAHFTCTVDSQLF